MPDATGTLPGSEEFAVLAAPYRRELLAHCYRMLGSVDDAEDQVQETLLRAWRSYADFEGRSSMRTWLHRIATNACLRALENRARRPLPSGLTGPSPDPDAPLPADGVDLPWLQPVPDALVSMGGADPASVVSSRASLRLALVAALQILPPRQRAVLILRDVLGWRAAEVADLLGTTTVAVNSALQRARSQLTALAPVEEDIREPTDPEVQDMLSRYATAFESADVARLAALLTADASMEMPPMEFWFTGREAISAFLSRRVLRSPGAYRMIPVGANGQPALAAYQREPDGSYRAHAIQVLDITTAGIARIVSFNDASLFRAFALPDSYPLA
jgi:RNA polymerase sigma-70 factor, ECF subfamily